VDRYSKRYEFSKFDTIQKILEKKVKELFECVAQLTLVNPAHLAQAKGGQGLAYAAQKGERPARYHCPTGARERTQSSTYGSQRGRW
jgi:hypothetical protein